jgi:hypothetical protein
MRKRLAPNDGSSDEAMLGMQRLPSGRLLPTLQGDTGTGTQLDDSLARLLCGIGAERGKSITTRAIARQRVPVELARADSETQKGALKCQGPPPGCYRNCYTKTLTNRRVRARGAPGEVASWTWR